MSSVSLKTFAAAGFLLAGSMHASASAQEHIVSNFAGPPSGHWPTGNLVMDSGGALYGVTSSGGLFGFGSVYRLTRPAAGTVWTLTTLYSFAGQTDGASPAFGLTIGGNGVLYGVTRAGGVATTNCSGCGTVFMLAPPAAGQTTWTKTTLSTVPDGNIISSVPAIASDGTLYGTMAGLVYANNFGPPDRYGYGMVYRLTPPAAGQTGWTLGTVYGFNGDRHGSDPSGKLLLEPDGTMFGTAADGGNADGHGTVFELVPTGGGAGWNIGVVHSFSGVDGFDPVLGVIQGKDGTLYGTTMYYQPHEGASDIGTAFSLSRPQAAQGAWQYQIIHLFGADGQYPSSLTIDKTGRLIGSTPLGSSSGYGSYFELSPPASGQNWIETGLVPSNLRYGVEPVGVLLGSDNRVYYTNINGGPSGQGYGTVTTVSLPGH